MYSSVAPIGSLGAWLRCGDRARTLDLGSRSVRPSERTKV